jgi:hypothetical protein
MLAAMEELSRSSVEHGELRLRRNQDRMREALGELVEKVRDSMDAAHKTEKEKDGGGGFFGDVIDAVADVAGEIAGTVADLARDAVVTPFEATAGIARNVTDPGAILNVLRAEMHDLATNGETADSVKDFTKGVVKLEASVIELMVKLELALARAGLEGRDLGDVIAGDAKELWESFRTNILENEGFWEVTSAIAKGAAVAGAAMSGGTLAFVAAGVFVLLEADAKTGFVAGVAGEDAAPWVRLGLHVAAAALLGAGAGSESRVLMAFQGGAAVLEGAKAIHDGVRAIEEGERRAKELENEADLLALKNGMARLRRTMDGLVALLEEEGRSHDRTRQMGADLYRARAAALDVVVMRA